MIFEKKTFHHIKIRYRFIWFSHVIYCSDYMDYSLGKNNHSKWSNTSIWRKMNNFHIQLLYSNVLSSSPSYMYMYFSLARYINSSRIFHLFSFFSINKKEISTTKNKFIFLYLLFYIYMYMYICLTRICFYYWKVFIYFFFIKYVYSMNWNRTIKKMQISFIELKSIESAFLLLYWK